MEVWVIVWDNTEPTVHPGDYRQKIIDYALEAGTAPEDISSGPNWIMIDDYFVANLVKISDIIGR